MQCGLNLCILAVVDMHRKMVGFLDCTEEEKKGGKIEDWTP